MFAVKVEYEVFPEYEGENKDRIQDFLKAFEGLDNSRFRYSRTEKASDSSIFPNIRMK